MLVKLLLMEYSYNIDVIIFHCTVQWKPLKMHSGKKPPTFFTFIL